MFRSLADHLRSKVAQAISTVKDDVPFCVRRYQILSTDVVVYEVWEKSPEGHSEITHMETSNGWWGRLGTRALPKDIAILRPGSDARLGCVDIWHQEQNDLAYELICKVFPEAAQGTRDGAKVRSTFDVAMKPLADRL